MVGFRNAVGSGAIGNWQSPQAQQIAFDRGTFEPGVDPGVQYSLFCAKGSTGFVAINNADSTWQATFTTSVPDGVYCNIIAGTFSSGKCSGNT